MDDLVESILDYIRADYTDYAIMINGEWGSGKTYFWNHKIRNKIEAMQINGKKYTTIYMSLYGISNLEEISKKIFIETTQLMDKNLKKNMDASWQVTIPEYAKTGLDMANSSDYKLLDRAVVDKIKEFKEGQLFFRGLVDWVGFDKYVLKIDIKEREIGKSKFKLKSLFKLAINAITSFSSSLLYITAFLGGIFFVSAVILAIQTLYNKIVGVSATGFTTVILLQLIIGSLVMFCLAIIGIYVGKIYEEVKRRPQYIISEVKRKD